MHKVVTLVLAKYDDALANRKGVFHCREADIHELLLRVGLGLIIYIADRAS